MIMNYIINYKNIDLDWVSHILIHNIVSVAIYRISFMWMGQMLNSDNNLWYPLVSFLYLYQIDNLHIPNQSSLKFQHKVFISQEHSEQNWWFISISNTMSYSLTQ